MLLCLKKALLSKQASESQDQCMALTNVCSDWMSVASSSGSQDQCMALTNVCSDWMSVASSGLADRILECN